MSIPLRSLPGINRPLFVEEIIEIILEVGKILLKNTRTIQEIYRV